MDIVDDSSSRLKYQGDWSIIYNTGAIEKTVHTSSDPNGYVSLLFTGAYIELDALKSPNGANFTVLLDGSSYGPYPLYSTNTSVTSVWSTTGLNPTATHTIEIHRATSTADVNGATDINIDAFQISGTSPSLGTVGLLAVANTSSTNGTSASTTTTTNVAMGVATSYAASSPTPTSSLNPLIQGNTKMGLIMGSIAAVAIGLCLITFVWWKSRKDKANDAHLRSSTTPKYRTTSVNLGLISPMGLYNRQSGIHNFGNRFKEPTVVNTVSSHSSYAGPTDRVNRTPVGIVEEGPEPYLLYPAKAPIPAPPP